MPIINAHESRPLPFPAGHGTTVPPSPLQLQIANKSVSSSSSSAVKNVGYGSTGGLHTAALVVRPCPPSPAGDGPGGRQAATTSLEPQETSVNFGENPSELGPSDGIISAFLNATPDAPPPETGAEGPAATEDQVFIHSGWLPMRKKVRAALYRTNQRPARVQAFDQCGANSWILQDSENPDAFRLQTNYCHDRLCTPCANIRSFRIRDALRPRMAGKNLSFITLTLSGKSQTLVEMVDRLYKHFRALRAHPEWDKNISGGCAFLEIKWNDKSQRWHPHLHLIAEATYWEQGRISTIWHTITHDSFMVHITRINEDGKACNYVTKYASKPLNPSFANSPKLLDEAVEALKGRRLALCFGTWYGTPLNEEDEDAQEDTLADVGRWQPIGTLYEVHVRACRGDPIARAALDHLGVYRRAIQPPTGPPG